MLLQDWAEQYLIINPNIQSENTRRLFRQSVRHLEKYLRRQALVADLTDDNLAAYVAHRRIQQRAPSTIEREVAKLLTLWRDAAQHGILPPPTLKFPRAKLRVPMAWVRKEVVRLFAEARRTKRTVGRHPYPNVPGKILWPAILGVVWDSAERIGAVAEVDRADIQVVRWLWFVRGAWITFRVRKGQGRALVRWVRRSTAKAVVRLMDATDSPKPLCPIHKRQLYHHLNHLLRDAGLPTDRWSKFHRLRRSHASYLKLAGGDARESLDHSSEEITRTRYYDPRLTQSRPATADLFDPVGWKARVLAWIGAA